MVAICLYLLLSFYFIVFCFLLLMFFVLFYCLLFSFIDVFCFLLLMSFAPLFLKVDLANSNHRDVILEKILSAKQFQEFKDPKIIDFEAVD